MADQPGDLLRRSPVASCDGRSAAFAEQVRDFRAFGAATVTLQDGGIPYFVNEFWTARQRQAHAIHEISYRACFKPQLPMFFIERLTGRDDVVYDPFMGRGTTPVEAALQGRRPLGNDVNPLAPMLIRPRLNPPRLAEVARRLDEIPWHRAAPEEPELLAFYSPTTLQQIVSLRHWLGERLPAGIAPDPVDDWIRMVAINRLTGHSTGFFSVYTLPPNQAASAAAQQKINLRRGQVPPDRCVKQLILAKTASLLRHGPPPAHPKALLLTEDARSTPEIPDASVRLIVTSPPFLDVVQYAADNWLRSWFAGIDPNSVAITAHRSEAAWQQMVRETLLESARIVAPGGHVAFEVGEVRRGKLLLERLVWEAAAGLPFVRLFVMINRQDFTKTANCWGVANNAMGTNTNRIIVLRRA